MRVLLINDYATPAGGAEIITLGLREELRRRGYDARLFSSDATPSPGPVQADYQCAGTTSRARALLQTVNVSAYFRLRSVLREFRPDVVHVRMFLTQLSPLILPLLRSVPSFYHVVWYRPVCPKGTKLLPGGEACTYPAGIPCLTQGCIPAQDWAPLMAQLSMFNHWRSAFRAIVANSYAVRDVLVREGISPVDVIWNGVPVQERRHPLTDPPTVTFAGRLVWEKGVDVLMAAFLQVASEIPGIKLVIAGDGEKRSELAQMAADANQSANVTFLGHVSTSEMTRQFASAWVQVVPSRWAEPFGIVAPEAMMRGVAVIASRSGGLAEIVRDGETGFLVPPGDVQAVAQGLRTILGDKQRAESMGEAGRTLALREFTQQVFTDRICEVYQRLSAPEAPGPAPGPFRAG